MKHIEKNRNEMKVHRYFTKENTKENISSLFYFYYKTPIQLYKNR